MMQSAASRLNWRSWIAEGMAKPHLQWQRSELLSMYCHSPKAPSCCALTLSPALSLFPSSYTNIRHTRNPTPTHTPSL